MKTPRDEQGRGEDDIKALEGSGLHVLPCHEIENLLIHPDTLAEVAVQLGQNIKVADLIVAASDESAGRWVFQRTCASGEFRGIDLPSVKKMAGPKKWTDVIEADGQKFVAMMLSAAGKCDAAIKIAFSGTLNEAIAEYRTVREKPELWRVCMGKETMHLLAKPLGIASADALERAVVTAWTRNPALRPDEYHKKLQTS